VLKPRLKYYIENGLMVKNLSGLPHHTSFQAPGLKNRKGLFSEKTEAARTVILEKNKKKTKAATRSRKGKPAGTIPLGVRGESKRRTSNSWKEGKRGGKDNCDPREGRELKEGAANEGQSFFQEKNRGSYCARVRRQERQRKIFDKGNKDKITLEFISIQSGG